MTNVDISDRKEQRKFGLVMAAGISVVGLIRWWAHGFGEPPLYFFYVAAAFAVLGLAVPLVLKPFFYVWMKFALAINWVMTRVMLLLAFWILIVPTRVLMKLFADDPLKRQWLPEETSYWEDAEEQPEEMDRYTKQF